MAVLRAANSVVERCVCSHASRSGRGLSSWAGQVACGPELVSGSSHRPTTTTHKHPRGQRWLDGHSRFHVHFTLTSASWLNMIERSFRDLTENRIRRGVFRDLEQLITAIGDNIDRHNENPKPFIWTAKASDIMEKVSRARTALHK